MKHLTTLITLLIASVAMQAATVTVTMNATAKTMTLTPVGSSTPLEATSHDEQTYTYVFEGVANGEYVIEGFNSTVSNGTINIDVQNEDITLQLWNATSRATNSGWIIGTDYTAENLSIRTREGKLYKGTIGYNVAAPYTSTTTMVALIPNGGSFNIELVPNEVHAAEGYMPAYPSATFTANAAQNMALQLGGEFTCSCPADAQLVLSRKPGGANGSGSIHFVPFITIEPTNVQTIGQTKTFTYRLANSGTYNIRTWREGGLTNYTKFTYYTDATKCPVINYTDAHYTARDPKWIDHDPSHNDKLNSVDILVNINERGHKRMSVGDVHDLLAERDWQIIPDQTSNYFFEPDYHYAVYDLEGNLDNSVVEVEKDGVVGSEWAFLRAKAPGTAIVTVTFDAACATQWTNNVEKDYYGGRYFCALWPENTAVFVVTVGDAAGAINPNMLLNQEYNLETSKLSTKYVDAEHDVFYYINDEEYAEYTFSPIGVSTVEIMYPTIRTNDAIYDNGWETVADNGDGSYTLHLVHGSQIVRLGDGAGHYVYQVLRAKHATRTITNTATGSNTKFCPGDEIKIQYDGLYHPANKLSGIYNMSAYITYNGTPTGTALILGSNQYWFAGTPSAQAVTMTIPYDYTDATLDLTEGVIQVTGYGDPIGNHRNIGKIAGRSPNFTAISHQTYFGKLPDAIIPVTQRKIVRATINVVPAEANVTIKNANDEVLLPETDGTYLLKEGMTSLYVQYTGYKRETQYIEITDETPDTKTYNIALTPIPANGWDGENMSEPSKVGGIYIIKSGNELAWFANEVNKATTTTIAYKAKLNNDIDLCGYNWTPISTATATNKAYKAVFDGNNKTVKNLYIETSTTRAALFGMVFTGAEIKNLTVEGTVISTATDSRAAGIVGQLAGTAKVTNCVNKANVSGLKYVAGIAGYVQAGGTIDKCANYGAITGVKTEAANSGQYVAGIAFCYNANGKITNCYNRGTILGDNYCGGIFCYSSTGQNATANNVYNTGYVHASGEDKNGYSCHSAIRATTSTTATTTKVTNAYANEDFLFNELCCTIITEPERWANGEVAYLLAETSEDAFGQEIGVDPLPVLGGMKVYKIGEGDDAFYSNTDYQEYTRTVTPGNYGTICLPWASEHFNGATFYSLEKKCVVDGELQYITLREETSLVAGRPYIFEADADEISVIYDPETEVSTPGSFNGLVGAFVQTLIPGYAGNWFLKSNKIWLAGDECYVGDNRAYIHLDDVVDISSSAPAGVQRRTIGNAEAPQTTTGVEQNIVGSMPEGIYDMLGRRYETISAPGIYIVNGMKVVITK